MEVRCTGCNKLFRVSDDKIVGSGVKFACTRCHETVRITREEFEQYKLANEAALLLASVAQKPLASPGAAVPSRSTPVAPPPDFPKAADDSSVFDLSDPASAAAALTETQRPAEPEGEIPGLFDQAAPFQASEPEPKKTAAAVQKETAPAASSPASPAPTEKVAAPARPKPAAVPEPASPVQTKPSAAAPAAAAPKTEIKPAAPRQEQTKTPARPKSEPMRPAAASPAVSASLAELLEKEAPAPGAAVFDAAPAKPASGFLKKALILAVVLLAAGGAVFGVMSYVGREPGRESRTAAPLVSPDGLQIVNPSAVFDSSKGDLVITGTVQNNTDKPKPAWYVVVEVYNAQNAVIARARLLSGKQLYTRRELDILQKRGADIRDLAVKSMEQGTTIPPRGSANFEIRILDAPAGVASFNPALQPFDPVQLFKELAEEQR